MAADQGHCDGKTHYGWVLRHGFVVSQELIEAEHNLSTSRTQNFIEKLLAAPYTVSS
jgi:hypothetical protein